MSQRLRQQSSHLTPWNKTTNRYWFKAEQEGYRRGATPRRVFSSSWYNQSVVGPRISSIITILWALLAVQVFAVPRKALEQHIELRRSTSLLSKSCRISAGR